MTFKNDLPASQVRQSNFSLPLMWKVLDIHCGSGRYLSQLAVLMIRTVRPYHTLFTTEEHTIREAKIKEEKNRWFSFSPTKKLWADTIGPTSTFSTTSLVRLNLALLMNPLCSLGSNSYRDVLSHPVEHLRQWCLRRAIIPFHNTKEAVLDLSVVGDSATEMSSQSTAKYFAGSTRCRVSGCFPPLRIAPTAQQDKRRNLSVPDIIPKLSAGKALCTFLWDAVPMERASVFIFLQLRNSLKLEWCASWETNHHSSKSEFVNVKTEPFLWEDFLWNFKYTCGLLDFPDGQYVTRFLLTIRQLPRQGFTFRGIRRRKFEEACSQYFTVRS